jgi:flagellar hook assembly protein FlgD
MSTVGTISGGSSAQQSVVGQLGSDEFLKIILQELQSQDPLEPNDTSQMLQQLSTIMSIQSDSNMMTRLSELVQQNELTSASNLIGHLITGLTEENERALGVVLSVTKTDKGSTLRLDDGTHLPMSRVDQIFERVHPEPLDDNSDSDQSDEDTP